MVISQGDILFVDLDPSMGNEMKRRRPCVVVSNNNYNRFFNTLIIAPISSSSKYETESKYRFSSAYLSVEAADIKGTILLQHLRTIDPNKRTDGKVVASISTNEILTINERVQQFL